jgi:hypothetical protein
LKNPGDVFILFVIRQQHGKTIQNLQKQDNDKACNEEHPCGASGVLDLYRIRAVTITRGKGLFKAPASSEEAMAFLELLGCSAGRGLSMAW